MTKEPSETSVILSAVTFVDSDGDTHVLCTLEDMIEAGLDEKIATEFMLAPGACRSRHRKNTIDCVDLSCTGFCHVISAPRGPSPQEEKDEGIGPINKQKNRFYWCRCV